MLASQSHLPARITFAKRLTLLIVESSEKKTESNPEKSDASVADFILVKNLFLYLA